MKRLAVVLALVGTVLAGCGGKSNLSKSAYQQRLQADAKPVGQLISSLSKTPPKTLTQLVTRLDQAEATAKKAADDLAAAKPPADVAADNAALVAGLRKVQAALEQVKANPVAAASIIGTIEKAPAIKGAEKALADLKSKGYSVGALGLP
jgi:hypothetical protein